MTKKQFKETLAKNGINIFYFCLINSFDANDVVSSKDEDEIDSYLISKLQEHIQKVNDLEGIFFDVAKSEGLRNTNDKVDFLLEGKNRDISLSFDASMLNKINFVL